ncbi:lytic transglycosylase domain-containing protein [Mycolicibacterium frederiksbergense]|uniref:lytic transglycosylase domain-containing protein n=1 Tax=Mycolicibacterium frederiksbergense TaxID=117567 RepID=UPI00265BF698|nr:lytic transglycosylase domain-containing protein [Mycolicibacterium frederiksbergense]MDO0976396.1 lytic transglycosylase domain-containing protein [Mycolicibacterium frederiksbergense]
MDTNARVGPTPIRGVTARLVAAFGMLIVLAGCSDRSDPGAVESSSNPPVVTQTSTPATPPPTPATPAPAQPRLAPEPAQVADDLVADEQTLRNPSSTPEARRAAARRQQAAYRVIGRNPEWDGLTRPRIPPPLLTAYDLNIEARRHLDALLTGEAKDTLPAWRIEAPPPAEELLAHYRESEAASGVGWNYLAAVNLIETRLGSIAGTSTAGAQGPMQFLPSTFAAYGDGGDIHAPRDSIMAAGRYLAANGFVTDPDHALYRYNNSDHYVQAVKNYAAVLAADPAAFAGYHDWEVYYRTTAGDVLLPVGYARTSTIPVAEYLAAHPQ